MASRALFQGGPTATPGAARLAVAVGDFKYASRAFDTISELALCTSNQHTYKFADALLCLQLPLKQSPKAGGFS